VIIKYHSYIDHHPPGSEVEITDPNFLALLLESGGVSVTETPPGGFTDSSVKPTLKLTPKPINTGVVGPQIDFESTLTED